MKKKMPFFCHFSKKIFQKFCPKKNFWKKGSVIVFFIFWKLWRKRVKSGQKNFFFLHSFFPQKNYEEKQVKKLWREKTPKTGKTPKTMKKPPFTKFEKIFKNCENFLKTMKKIEIFFFFEFFFFLWYLHSFFPKLEKWSLIFRKLWRNCLIFPS